ncbi:histidine kinase N-terminal 7TM domain-containing protein [Haloarchaeobius sp. HME9146]|uniref:histidine kinase N-terminal 7TM domain-containing protein n=1 Tax=Haloarchaeobius sp. HME9146 TaxID=2978732 RepID=UPI0021BF75AE|nr:histidine kinase N-terminal 7TM domain-containing protein [Haloarchaeobius sp. HME9146]MCT9094646.1 hypothetical protein [Haloarchaeobius sp. HME9146]
MVPKSFLPFSTLLVAGSALILAASSHAPRHRATGAVGFAAGIAVLSLTSLLEMFTGGFSLLLVLHVAGFLGFAVAAGCWFWYALSRRTANPSPLVLAPVALVLAGGQLLVATNSLHGLYWQSASVVTRHGDTVLSAEPGIAYFALLAFTHAVFLAGAVVHGREALRGDLGGALAVVGYAAVVFGIVASVAGGFRGAGPFGMAVASLFVAGSTRLD